MGRRGREGWCLAGECSAPHACMSARLHLACSKPVNSPATQFKQDRLRGCTRDAATARYGKFLHRFRIRDRPRDPFQVTG